MVLFTNEDDPFGSVTGPVKTDMIRTTIQRAKVIEIPGFITYCLSCKLNPIFCHYHKQKRNEEKSVRSCLQLAIWHPLYLQAAGSISYANII